MFTVIQPASSSVLLQRANAQAGQEDIADAFIVPVVDVVVEEKDQTIKAVDAIDEETGAIVLAMSPSGDIHAEFAQAQAETTQDDVTRYITREGDTLADIADIFDISVATIKYANPGIADKKIKPGQELEIPPVDGVKYKVQKGDTIGGIAAKFKVSAEDIRDFNYIFDNKIVAGKTLFIPEGKPLPPKPKKTTPSYGSSKPVASPGFSFSGTLGKPVNGTLTSGYGPRGGGMHRGVDWGAPTGTPIYAAASGYVKKASVGYNGGYGKVVVIGHDTISLDTLYAHMSKIAVTPGQYVNKGEVIGYIGSTGRSTGPHLHFEVRKNGKPVNPSGYLR